MRGFSIRRRTASLCCSRSAEGRPTWLSTTSPLHSRRFISSTSATAARSLAGSPAKRTKLVPNRSLTRSVTAPKSDTTSSKGATTNPSRAGQAVR